MLEGRYSAIFFEADPQTGWLGDVFARGVIEFSGGKIFGGDSGYHYQGTYEMVDQTRYNASIKVAPHTAQPLQDSPFGPRGTTLDVRGATNHGSVSCGREIRTLGQPFQIKLTRIVG